MTDTPGRDAPRRLGRTAEVATTVLLAVAAVATAWASYQASRWHGEQAQAQSKATSLRLESTRSSGLANRQVQIDVATFIEWADGALHDDAAVQQFYRARFREEFRPAFDAWLALDPLNDPSAPPTPFALPEYVLDANVQADRLEAEAATASDAARTDIQRADNYVLGVVLFAASLFFAGISTRLRSVGAQLSILALGYVIFLGTLAWMLTFPVSFAT